MLTYPQFVQFVRQAVPRFALQWLNTEQDDAVRANLRPPTFIVAGPGTGKTTVLALRVLKLILVDGLAPSGIIATTFTRKAAAELRSRILAWGYATIAYARIASAGQAQIYQWLTQLNINQISVGTLDSLAEQFLADTRPPGGINPAPIEAFFAAALMRRYGLFPNRRDQNAQLEAFIATFVPTYPGPRPFSVKLGVSLNFADRVRHDNLDLNALAARGPGQQVLREIVVDYLDYLANNHFADFARLEVLLLERLQQNRLQRITNGVQAILVDEFQDTNYLQEQIYFEFCSKTGASFTVVGDDDQSVFRFRGATVEIFANFENRIVNSLGQNWRPQRVDLIQNYRSVQKIVQFCNRFVQLDPGYQGGRVPGKQGLVASAAHAQHHHPPVLGMFRTSSQALATDLTQFLINIFRGHGERVTCAHGEVYEIERDPAGDFGDAVLLTRSAQEYGRGDPPRPRLPLMLRDNLSAFDVPVFNPRGRSLFEIDPVQILLGLALLSVDGNGGVLQSITAISPAARGRIMGWRHRGMTFAQTNPQPGGLLQFIQNWQMRTLPPNSQMRAWPDEWPLLDLLFTLVTWIPDFQVDPEGQVYLEAIARTVGEAAQFSSYGGRILNGTGAHDRGSVLEIIREVFVSIADGNVEVDEEIMPYVPRRFFPIMTIHQAKGLEFPLVIVDVGSDFRTNNVQQRRFRFPESPDTVHIVENLIAPFSPIGVARTQRPALERAWDDLRRLYYVAYSRPENVLLLVGLTTQIAPTPRVRSIATGDIRGATRALDFVPAAQWHSSLPIGSVALI